MNPDPDPTRQTIQAAWQALRQGDRQRARELAQMAAALAPEQEEPWLILAALAEPRESIAFLESLLEKHPESASARKAMRWAVSRLKDTAGGASSADRVHPVSPRVERPKDKKRKKAKPPAAMPAEQPAGEQVKTVTPESTAAVPEGPPPVSITQPSVSRKRPKPKEPGAARRRLRALGYSFAGLVMLGLLVWFFLPGNTTHALAFLRSIDDALLATATLPGAPAHIAKPTYTPSLTPTATNTPTPTATNTPTFTATFTPTDTPTATLTPTNTSTPTDTPIPSPTPIVSDTPVPTLLPPSTACVGGTESRWIDVDLGEQMLYACEYDNIAASFIVSTGTYLYPTRTGDYHIYLKLVSTRMIGPGYDLPNVPYTMYYSGDYGIHGTYWHNNFGTPMSHGCINMRTPDAEWLYYWAADGTLVHIHY